MKLSAREKNGETHTTYSFASEVSAAFNEGRPPRDTRLVASICSLSGLASGFIFAFRARRDRASGLRGGLRVEATVLKF